jgi:hypothetical protein
MNGTVRVFLYPIYNKGREFISQPETRNEKKGEN